MNRQGKTIEPLCQTSEIGEEIFSEDELTNIKSAIGRRIVEAFNYHPDAEIAFLLKTSCRTVKSITEGEEFPSVEILLSIQKTAGVSLHWLLTGEGSKRPLPEIPAIISEESMIYGLA